MTSIQDSVVFGPIFSDPRANHIWSDRTRTQYYLDFEAALAKVQARLDIIPNRAAEEIQKWCDDDCVDKRIDWRELSVQTASIGYPVLPVVKQIVDGVNRAVEGEKLGEWSHWGATTQDLTDTATIMQIRDTMSVMREYLGGILRTMTDLAERHKATPMAARSNLQQAVPMTFGFKLARLVSAFVRHRERMEEARSRILCVEFSGAVGTLATIPATESRPELGLECQRFLAEELHLSVPEICWHTDRDRIAEFGTLCAHLTSTCSKFALDVKLMNQTEIGEVAEPYHSGRGSSSTMPQKRNPVSCVYITSLAATVRQLSTSLFESAANQDHERSTGPWEIEWIVLPQIATLTCACLRQTRDLVAGLEVNEDAMRSNLDITKGNIVSEAVMMGLGRVGMGRQRAHDVVYECCQRAAKEKGDLVDKLWEDQEIRGLMTREDLGVLCDPKGYLGYSVVMTEKVVEESRETMKT